MEVREKGKTERGVEADAKSVEDGWKAGYAITKERAIKGRTRFHNSVRF